MAGTRRQIRWQEREDRYDGRNEETDSKIPLETPSLPAPIQLSTLDIKNSIHAGLIVGFQSRQDGYETVVEEGERNDLDSDSTALLTRSETDMNAAPLTRRKIPTTTISAAHSPGGLSTSTPLSGVVGVAALVGWVDVVLAMVEVVAASLAGALPWDRCTTHKPHTSQ